MTRRHVLNDTIRRPIHWAGSLFLFACSSSLVAAELEQTETTEVFPLPEIIVTAKKIQAPPSIIVRSVGLEDIEA